MIYWLKDHDSQLRILICRLSVNKQTRLIKDVYLLDDLFISSNPYSYCLTKQFYSQLGNFRQLYCKNTNWLCTLRGMKIVIHNKCSTFKIIGKQLHLNEVVPPPGSHFWDELAFISMNICGGHSIGSGNWSGLKLTWQDKQTVVAFNMDFKDYLHFSQVMASTSVSWKAPFYLHWRNFLILILELKKTLKSILAWKSFYFSAKICSVFKSWYFLFMRKSH